MKEQEKHIEMLINEANNLQLFSNKQKAAEVLNKLFRQTKIPVKIKQTASSITGCYCSLNYGGEND